MRRRAKVALFVFWLWLVAFGVVLTLNNYIARVLVFTILVGLPLAVWSSNDL